MRKRHKKWALKKYYTGRRLTLNERNYVRRVSLAFRIFESLTKLRLSESKKLFAHIEAVYEQSMLTTINNKQTLEEFRKMIGMDDF